jgi:hypothetical protein
VAIARTKVGLSHIMQRLSADGKDHTSRRTHDTNADGLHVRKRLEARACHMRELRKFSKKSPKNATVVRNSADIRPVAHGNGPDTIRCVHSG